MRAGALAIFVKTPGLSPVKTRLAVDVGQEAAERFFLTAVGAVAALADEVRVTTGIDIYWAVAEDAGLEHPMWSRNSRVHQGQGELGERLDTVYRSLLERHPFVLLIGADCVHLSPAIISEAASALKAVPYSKPYVIGRTLDGGFYLFGGNQPVAKELWLSVPYSAENTAEQLIRKLTDLGAQPYELASLFDVDQVADLSRLTTIDMSGVLPGQQAAILEGLAIVDAWNHRRHNFRD